jgi:hypothetical protein
VRQDLLTLRVVARFAYAVANSASSNASAATGYPFAVLNRA